MPASLTLFMVGAALLAAWVVATRPSFGPHTVRAAAVHLLVAIAAGALAPPGIEAVGALTGPYALLAALLLVVLPALLYLFLALFWVVRVVQGMLLRA